MIKPIETVYKGYRFRSRLEARWAICFDALGMIWEYEKEGFPLISGPYLPDFWLPYPGDLNFSGYHNAGHWLEVKGQEPTQHELAALLHLSIHTNHSGILVWGPPWDFKRYFTHRSGNHGWIPIFPDDTISDLWVIATRFCSPSFDMVDEAMQKSKSARFEHGERG